MEGLDLHLATVGDLLAVVEEDLFPQDFRGEETEVLVRELVLVEPGRGFRKAAGNRLQDALQVEFLLGRRRDDLRHRELLVPPLHQFHDLLLGGDVDLVDHQDDGALDLREFLDVGLILVALLHGVGDIEDDVRVADGRVHEVQHVLLEPVVGLQDARGVGIHDLVVLPIDDAHDAVPRRLGLRRDDGKLLAHQGVHEGGLPDVRVADDVDETCPVCHYTYAPIFRMFTSPSVR